MSSMSYIATCFTPINGSSFDFVSIRAISFSPTHPHLYIASFHFRACRLDMGVFLALGGLFRAICSVQMSKKLLAALVLDMPKHISTYLLVHALFLYGLTVCEH